MPPPGRLSEIEASSSLASSETTGMGGRSPSRTALARSSFFRPVSTGVFSCSFGSSSSAEVDSRSSRQESDSPIVSFSSSSSEATSPATGGSPSESDFSFKLFFAISSSRFLAFSASRSASSGSSFRFLGPSSSVFSSLESLHHRSTGSNKSPASGSTETSSPIGSTLLGAFSTSVDSEEGFSFPLAFSLIRLITIRFAV